MIAEALVVDPALTVGEWDAAGITKWCCVYIGQYKHARFPWLVREMWDDVGKGERVLFNGTQFSNLYTTVGTPARAA
jgi:hypothetical protein